MAGRWHHTSWRPPAPDPRTWRLREHHPHLWATLQDDYPYSLPSWPAESAASAASVARPEPARGGPGANIPGAQMPLADLVRRHSLPEVDPDWPSTSDEVVTTMAIMNIPHAYPKWMLQRDISNEGLAHDYFHCPVDTRQDRNRGVAFVNFLTPEAAEAFQRSFNSRELSYPGAGSKVVTVLPSTLQGLEANANLHPEGLVLDQQQPRQQQPRPLQRHQQQPRQQLQPAASGSSSSGRPQAAAPAEAGHRAASSSARAAPGPPHAPSPPGSALVIYRLSL